MFVVVNLVLQNTGGNDGQFIPFSFGHIFKFLENISFVSFVRFFFPNINCAVAIHFVRNLQNPSYSRYFVGIRRFFVFSTTRHDDDYERYKVLKG